MNLIVAFNYQDSCCAHIVVYSIPIQEIPKEKLAIFRSLRYSHYSLNVNNDIPTISKFGMSCTEEERQLVYDLYVDNKYRKYVKTMDDNHLPSGELITFYVS